MAMQPTGPRAVFEDVTYYAWFLALAVPLHLVAAGLALIGLALMRVIWWTAPEAGREILRERGYGR